MTQIATTDRANVPLPAGAVKVSDWDGHPDDGRYWAGPMWRIDARDHFVGAEPIFVQVEGMQYPDGRVKREIGIHQLHGATRSPPSRQGC